ncbi:MAG TPA: twin-arginine translocase TatA/TatE family subunit [Propionibacteriaceae bacterium]|nr:twin-arginine translocase TatA/TatE family subunit [Propionibacteriaceae bacterium]
MFGLGWQELLIILFIAVLLFGGTRLAGVGKASGKAIREFKEETSAMRDADKKKAVAEAKQVDEVVDAEIVQAEKKLEN